MLTTFGKIIRHKRLDQNQTLKALADRLGVSSSFLSAVELGKAAIPADWTDRIAQLLALSDGERDALRSAAAAHERERKVPDGDAIDAFIRKLLVSRHLLGEDDVYALDTCLTSILDTRESHGRNAA